jgi:DNA-binding NarL/FixJ family response regulator
MAYLDKNRLNICEAELKRVLVFRGENLLTAGVESLLTRQDDLLVLSVANNCDDAFSFEHEIELFHPSVVILEESSLSADFSFIYEVFKKYPQLRVIVVDEGDNLVHILDKRAITVAQSTDLIEVIRRDHHYDR